MQKGDKIMRLIAFYISIILFFVLLPVIISYSLGYKIDLAKLKIYKTGILYLASNPTGASIYLDGRLERDITPTRIEELKPGTYTVEVRRIGFYPWQKELLVRPNMVTKVDEIVLFPIIQEMDRIGDLEVEDFIMSDRNVIFYMARSGLYKANVDGTNLKRLSNYTDWPHDTINSRVAPDGEKFFYFDANHVWVVYLNLDKNLTAGGESAKVEEIFKSPGPIMDAFWYSGSNYIVIITDKEIKVAEIRSGEARNIVTLYRFNARPRNLYYDKNNDSLYFTDFSVLKYEKSKGQRQGNYIYRLDLRQKFFDQFMKRFRKEFEIKDETR